MKTGYTKDGGYGMVGSAVQNDTRLIVVINGLEDPDDRASEAKKMLEWGFRNFETRTLFAANQPVGYAKVFGGESRSVKLSSSEPIKVMVPENGSEKLIARVIYNRLFTGMPLQIDATLLYGQPPGTSPSAMRDIDTPYNTYLHTGLPPTPIANPGRASIQAATPAGRAASGRGSRRGRRRVRARRRRRRASAGHPSRHR